MPPPDHFYPFVPVATINSLAPIQTSGPGAPSASGPSLTPHSSRKLVILGVAIGSAALALLAVVAIIYVKRRKSNRQTILPPQAQTEVLGAIEPFTIASKSRGADGSRIFKRYAQ